MIFGSYGDFVARHVRSGEKRALFGGSDYNVWIAFHPAGDLAAASCLEPQDSTFIGMFTFDSQAAYRTFSAPGIRFTDNLDSENLTTDVPARFVFHPRGHQIICAATDANVMQTRAEIEELGALLGVVSVFRFPECTLERELPLLGRLQDLTPYLGYNRDKGQEETVYGASGFVTNIALLGGPDAAVAAVGLPSGSLAFVDCGGDDRVTQTRLHNGAIRSVERLSETVVATVGDDGCVLRLDATKALREWGALSAADPAEIAEQAQRSRESFLADAVEGELFYIAQPYKTAQTMMKITLQQAQEAVDQRIATELIAVTPENWNSAKLVIERAVVPSARAVDSPAGELRFRIYGPEPSTFATPSPAIYEAAYDLDRTFRKFGHIWTRVTYQVEQQPEGAWKYLADFEYKYPPQGIENNEG